MLIVPAKSHVRFGKIVSGLAVQIQWSMLVLNNHGVPGDEGDGLFERQGGLAVANVDVGLDLNSPMVTRG